MFGLRSAQSRRQTRIRKPPSGCGILLAVALASCALLALNGFLIAGFYGAMGDQLPVALRNPKVMQAIVFVGPVVLLVIEWRLTQSLLRTLDHWLRGR